MEPESPPTATPTTAPATATVRERKATVAFRRAGEEPRRVQAGVVFMVDDDQAEDLMPDAVLGLARRDEGFVRETIARPRESDVQVAANKVVAATLNAGLGGSASAAVPPGWTWGLAVPTEGTRAEGHTRVEGGWDVDPSSLDLVDAAFDRSVEQARKFGRRTAEKALQAAYADAAQLFRGVVASAEGVHYDFTPRVGERAPAEAKIPWANLMRYEIASRSLDRMWASLRVTREAAGGRSFETQMLGLLSQGFGSMARGMSPESEPAVIIARSRDQMSGLVRALIERFRSARLGSMRLVMQASALDADKRALQPGSVVELGSGEVAVAESLFFGIQHSVVEREILNATVADGLRYMFAPGRRAFTDTPSFGYTAERVVVGPKPSGTLVSLGMLVDAAHETLDRGHKSVALAEEAVASAKTPKKKATAQKRLQNARQRLDKVRGQAEAAERGFLVSADASSFGLRISIPQAPRGYTRGTVVMLLRTPKSVDDPALRTDAILVGSIPDSATYVAPDDPDGARARSVSDLPASFVIYHSGGRRDPDVTGNPVGTIVLDRDHPRDGPRWEATNDLAWLEALSGDQGRMHPVGNGTFRTLINEGYLSPFRTEQSRALAHDPRIEIFVEHHADASTVQAGRDNRRVIAKRTGKREVGRTARRGREMREFGAAYVSYFATPVNASSMRRVDLPGIALWQAATEMPLAPGRPLATVRALDPSLEALFTLPPPPPPELLEEEEEEEAEEGPATLPFGLQQQQPPPEEEGSPMVDLPEELFLEPVPEPVVEEEEEEEELEVIDRGAVRLPPLDEEEQAEELDLFGELPEEEEEAPMEVGSQGTPPPTAAQVAAMVVPVEAGAAIDLGLESALDDDGPTNPASAKEEEEREPKAPTVASPRGPMPVASLAGEESDASAPLPVVRVAVDVPPPPAAATTVAAAAAAVETEDEREQEEDDAGMISASDE